MGVVLLSAGQPLQLKELGFLAHGRSGNFPWGDQRHCISCLWFSYCVEKILNEGERVSTRWKSRATG